MVWMENVRTAGSMLVPLNEYTPQPLSPKQSASTKHQAPSTVLNLLQVILLQLAVEGALGDAQVVGGVLALVVVLFQGLKYHFLFLHVERQRLLLGFVGNVFHPLAFVVVANERLYV